jgi:hypothetical protein
MQKMIQKELSRNKNGAAIIGLGPTLIGLKQSITSTNIGLAPTSSGPKIN